jgi:hypothetical protein
MRLRWLWVAALLALLGSVVPARAETVHLNTGESIKGKIVRSDADSVSIESDKGFGVIQIKRSDITLIEFDQNERDLSRLVGIGYYHRATPSSVSSQASEYGVDALSLKMWMSKFDSVELQLGYFGATTSGVKTFEVFSVDVRYADVFKRTAGLDVYWGGSLGYLNVTDYTSGRNIKGTGYSYRAFLGLEMFFLTLPNVGISSELSVGSQSVGDSSTTNLSTTTFPAFSIRYYF